MKTSTSFTTLPAEIQLQILTLAVVINPKSTTSDRHDFSLLVGCIARVCPKTVPILLEILRKHKGFWKAELAAAKFLNARHRFVHRWYIARWHLDDLDILGLELSRFAASASTEELQQRKSPSQKFKFWPGFAVVISTSLYIFVSAVIFRKAHMSPH